MLRFIRLIFFSFFIKRPRVLCIECVLTFWFNQAENLMKNGYRYQRCNVDRYYINIMLLIMVIGTRLKASKNPFLFNFSVKSHF